MFNSFAIMFFNEDHLRITKIRTSDGLSPIIGSDERPEKKIIFAPLNPQTKKLFEEANTRLPNQLKMKIEVVKAYKPEPIVAAPPVDISAYEKRIAELEQKNKELESAQLQSAVITENGNGAVKQVSETKTPEKNISK